MQRLQRKEEIMITVLLLLGLLVVTIVVATIRTVALDGYGAIPTRTPASGPELPPTSVVGSRSI